MIDQTLSPPSQSGDALTLTLPDGSTRHVSRGTLPADVVGRAVRVENPLVDRLGVGVSALELSSLAGTGVLGHVDAGGKSGDGAHDCAENDSGRRVVVAIAKWWHGA